MVEISDDLQFDDGDDLLRRPEPPRTWRERIEMLADATGTSPARLAVGAVFVVLGILGGMWLLRAPPAPPEASLPFASTTAATAPSESTTTAATTLVVHVAGAVVAPGVYELAVGSRVVDAVGAAGGLAPPADPGRLNLAAPLADGERVYVLALGEDVAPVAPVADGAGASAGTAGAGPVNLNSADEAALDSLPGVGPATAKAIIDHRAKIGRFGSIEQLLDVPGIGDAKLDALRDLVTV